MFYCDECAKKKGWPESMFRSRGPCEVCGETKVCSSRKSSLLPSNARVLEGMNDAAKRLGLPTNAQVVRGMSDALGRMKGRPASEALIEARRVAGRLEASATIDLDSLPPATRAALQMPADLARLSIAGAGERPSPPRSGGSAEIDADAAAETPVSLEEEALGRVIEVDRGAERATVIVPADAPPPPPRVPGFTRVLSAEGFARWCRRMPLGDDPALNAHCVEARRRWHRYSVVLQTALPRLQWDFPSFTPKARPYDWSVDA